MTGSAGAVAAAAMRSWGRYSSRQRRLCCSQDSWCAELSGDAAPPPYPHPHPPQGPRAPHHHSPVGMETRMVGVGIGGQGGPQWGPMGIGCGYEGQKVGCGGCRGWGGLGGRGSEIRFTTADGYSRGTRLPAELSAEGVPKTFCQRHSDVSVRHTRLGVCPHGSSPPSPPSPPSSQSGSSAGPSLPVRPP